MEQNETPKPHHTNKQMKQKRYIQKLWGTMKRPNLQIIGSDEREESSMNSIDQTFNTFIE